MKIGIMGAGAIGAFIGSVLQRSGHEVTFIARGQHLEAIKKNGLIIETNSEIYKVDGTFSNDPSALYESDLVLFCVKSNDTEETANRLQNVIKKEASILTLQNGVENEEILSNIFGKERVFSCSTYIQSAILKPGTVKQVGDAKLVIGELNSSAMNNAQIIAAILNESGINTRYSSEIMNSKWKKYIWNVTFNPLSAVLGVSVGEILDQKNLRAIAKKINSEVISLAQIQGYHISKSFIDKMFLNTNIESVRNHKTSMLQDRLNGKQMEIESLCGYTVRKGKELGVLVPTIETIYNILKYIERSDPKVVLI
jgi:2-dehydropantoate 2-reductase